MLARQALEFYPRHLRPDGILTLHITNTHLDLAPIVETLRCALGKHAILISNEKDNERTIYRAVDARIIKTHHVSVNSASRFVTPLQAGTSRMD